MTKRKKYDSSEFRKAIGDVQPLRGGRSKPPDRPKPDARARFTRSDQKQVLAESLTGAYDPAEIEAGDELSYRRSGVQESVLRRLRRGQYSVEAEIDLHGLTAEEARLRLHDFLAECHTRHVHCVRVIHGKGRRSGNRGPVLKRKVNDWLRLRRDVIAFGTARNVDGGTGAIYVLLAKH